MVGCQSHVTYDEKSVIVTCNIMSMIAQNVDYKVTMRPTSRHGAETNALKQPRI